MLITYIAKTIYTTIKNCDSIMGPNWLWFYFVILLHCMLM